MDKHELEIVEQARVVLGHLCKCKDYNKEKQKKEFLYDLSLLNSMAAKGYLVSRTPLDEMIYNIKAKACNEIASCWPKRCRYDKHYSSHDSVLYVYAAGRQYSYHADLVGSVEGQVDKARWGRMNDILRGEWHECIEWDGIRNGWSLTDDEYKERFKESREFQKQFLVKEDKEDPLSNDVPRTQSEEFQTKLKYLRAIAVAEEGLRVENLSRRYKEIFWEYLDERLPAQKKRNKCYKQRAYWTCKDLYYPLIADMFSEEEKSWEHLSLYDTNVYKEYVGDCRKDVANNREKVVRRLYFALLHGKKLTSDMLLPDYD